MQNNQAIAKRNENQQLSVVQGGFQRNAIAKLDMRELKELADVFVTSKMFPDVQSAAQAMVKIIAGNELGFEPIVSMTGIHIFQGKVSIGANLLASLIKDSGKYNYRITTHSNEVCEAVFYEWIKDEWKQLGVPVAYTLKDATAAGLTSKDVWKKYPADMLFASVIRKGCRRYCADVLRGTVSEHDAALDIEIDARSVETERARETEAIDAEPVIETPDVTTPEFTGGPEATEPPFERSEESIVEDLRTAVKDRIKEITGGKAAAVHELLNGRVVSQMDKKQLTLFLKEMEGK